MLIVFMALTALVNVVLGWASAPFLATPLSLERLFGWVFAPLAWVMGVPAGDVTKVASLLGQKTALNEFVAYSHMSRMLADDPNWLSERGRLDRVVRAVRLCQLRQHRHPDWRLRGIGAGAPHRAFSRSRCAPCSAAC